MMHPSRVCLWTALIGLWGAVDAKETIVRNLPIFGRITMEKVSDSTYKGAVEDRKLGPLQLSEGTAEYSRGNTTVTYKQAKLLGKTFQLAFSQQFAPLGKQAMQEKVIVGQVQAQDGSRVINIGGIPLENAQIVISKNPLNIFIEGEFTQFGLTFIGRATISERVKFTAALKDTPESLKPFQEIAPDAPDALKDIQLTGIEVGIRGGIQLGKMEDGTEVATEGQDGDTQEGEEQDTSDRSRRKKQSALQRLSGSIYFEGTLENLPIVDKKLKGRLSIGMEGDVPHVTAVVKLPDGWKPSDIIPSKVNVSPQFTNVIDAFPLKEGVFVITTREEYQYQEFSYDRGISAYLRLGLPEKGANNFTDAIRKMFQQAGIPLLKEIEIGGYINPTDGSMELTEKRTFSGLAFDVGEFHFGEWELGSKFAVDPPKVSFGLLGTGHITPPKQKEALTFTGAFELTTGPTSPVQVGGSLSMQGAYESPLGVKGITIQDLGASYHIGLARTSATAGFGLLFPPKGGLTGKASIQFTPETTTEAEYTLQIGTNLAEWAYRARIEDAPSFPEIAAFLLRQLNQKPQVPMKRIVPIDVNKAMLEFTPLGTDVGRIRIEQGIGAKLDIRVLGHKGDLDIGARFSDIGLTGKGSMDPLHLGPVHITGAQGEGKPRVDVQLNAKEQKFVINGRVLIGDENNPLFQSETDVRLAHDAMRYEFDHKIGPFNACVYGYTTYDDASKKPEDFQLTIDLKQDFVNQLKELVTKFAGLLKDASEAGITGEQPIDIDKLDTATIQEKRAALQKKAEALNKQWDPKIKEKNKQIEKAEEKIQALKGQWSGTAGPGDIEKYKEQKKQREKELKQIKEKYAKERKRAAHEVLKDLFVEAGEFVIEVGEDIAQALLEQFNIQRIYTTGSTKELIKGRAPKFAVFAEIGGKQKCSEFQFNFNKPEHSLRRCVVGIVNLVAGRAEQGELCKNPPESPCVE